MKTIWKFETPFEDRFTLKLPIDAEIICVQIDEKTNIPCIFAIVDSSNDLEHRYFELFGTGNPIHVDMGIERKYLGTYQLEKGKFIGHLFERIN